MGSANSWRAYRHSYVFATMSGWTSYEQAAWKAALALWSDVANINFTQAQSQSSADFAIIRGNDGASAINNPRPLTVGSLTLPRATSGKAEISVDTNISGFGPLSTDYSSPINNYPFGTAVHELGQQPRELADHVWSLLSVQGQRLVKEGKIIEDMNENLTELMSQAQLFIDKQMPILKALQII